MSQADTGHELTPIERELGAHIPICGARLKGRGAIVSGAGAAGDVLGIGAAIAVLFAAQGAGVTLLDLDAERAARTAGIIERLGGRSQVVIGDVRSDADCAAAVARTVDRFGSLDALVNNTALARAGVITDITDDIWDLLIDVNLTGVMRMTRAAVPALTQAKGAIVNLASIAGMQGFGTLAYSASKGGVIAMTRDMAHTLGPSGVRVNCIAPGHLATPMGGVADPVKRETRRRATMLEIEGSAWDAAWAALFLAGPESRWITAEVIVVDAGSTQQPCISALQSVA